MKLKKNILGAVIILTCFIMNLKGQANHYFHHNENWSIYSYGAYSHEDIYLKVAGDTVLNGDSLVKIMMQGAFFNNPWDFWGFMGSATIPSFFAKDSAKIVTLYKFDHGLMSITDTIINDYSRSDSITHRILGPWGDSYEAMAIVDTSSFTIGGIIRMQFDINNELPNPSDDFVYEGLFSESGSPFFDAQFEYANYLTCFDATDSMYYDPLYEGSCIIHNLGSLAFQPKSLKIFPNPTTQTLFITNLENWQGEIIFLTNYLGQIIKEISITETQIELNVADLPSGLYVVNCVNKDFSSRTVFIKN